jgi:D-glycero-alpha-D-manno-heptose-7-phosphate kinase
MIITRTPFRISFAGGGSDLETFHREEPGFVLSTAIDKYMFVAVKPHFGSSYRISYSRTENVDSIDKIEHPIVRECLKMMGIERRLEIVSLADLPAQSGMASSSSFTVGLLHALHGFEGRVVSAGRLAREACDLEIGRLHEPIGKQDQYIAAYGGFQFMQFRPDGEVFVDPVVCAPATREELNRRLVLFFTGMSRPAGEVLRKQSANTESNRPALRHMCGIAHQLREVLTAGTDLNEFGRLLQQSWEAKCSLEATITNSRIDDYYQRGLKAGALGGKLLGAGNGGFLLFFCEPHRQARLREELQELEEAPFRFAAEGSKIVYVGD